MTDPTLAELRPAPGSAEHPVHRRTIEMAAYERGDHHVVIGTLRDVRPWASGTLGPSELHTMELAIVVRRADLTIVDAAATMHAFPHAECTDIEPAFTDLIGVSVARGYTSVVQEKFGRQRGCSHLEFLARALGPVVMQMITSSAAMRVELADGEYPAREGALGWLTNTCHVWSEDGPGPRKIEVGWRPGLTEYPAPSVVEIRRRAAADEGG